jgi:hypothetical protein
MSPGMRVAKASIVVAAAISFALSIYLWFTGSRDQALFVAIWVPSILSFGALVFAGVGVGNQNDDRADGGAR